MMVNLSKLAKQLYSYDSKDGEVKKAIELYISVVSAYCKLQEEESFADKTALCEDIIQKQKQIARSIKTIKKAWNDLEKFRTATADFEILSSEEQEQYEQQCLSWGNSLDSSSLNSFEATYRAAPYRFCILYIEKMLRMMTLPDTLLFFMIPDQASPGTVTEIPKDKTAELSRIFELPLASGDNPK